MIELANCYGAKKWSFIASYLKGLEESNAGKGSECHKKIVPSCKDLKSANCVYVQFFCWEYKLNFALDSIVITTPLAIIECLFQVAKPP